MNSKKDNISLQIAESEIERLLQIFSISNFKKEFITKKFLIFYAIFKDRKLYGDPKILVPISLFFCLRLHGISINIFDLIDHSQITKKQFLCFIFQVLDFLLCEQEMLSVNNIPKLLEGCYERRKFHEFRKFIRFYSNCPICGRLHDKAYIITQYFNSNKIFKKKLIKKIKKSEKVFLCKIKNPKCIFFKGEICNFGIPCRDCINQY
ncbi:MAG: hypothetical protein ACFFC3_15065 [Candidatus Odinarchaeota archaeon]